MRCDHNVIHLNWQRAMLHMHYVDFVDVANFLEGARTNIQPNHCCGNKRLFVMECPRGYCQTWLLGLGLHIRRDEFNQLASLVNMAHTNLHDNDLSLRQTGLGAPRENSICQTIVNGRGMIHINWCQTTLCLRPAEFEKAVCFLRNKDAQLVQGERFGDGEHFIERNSENFYQIWLRGMGLYLYAEDFERFLDLVTQAEKEMMKQTKPQLLTFPSFDSRPLGYLFSEN